jgi:hypothetical protein
MVNVIKDAVLPSSKGDFQFLLLNLSFLSGLEGGKAQRAPAQVQASTPLNTKLTTELQPDWVESG